MKFIKIVMYIHYTNITQGVVLNSERHFMFPSQYYITALYKAYIVPIYTAYIAAFWETYIQKETPYYGW